LIQF
jgi:GTP cyclohydrolase I